MDTPYKKVPNGTDGPIINDSAGVSKEEDN
jgi:hypothetical protein